MASEAFVLGVPYLYLNPLRCGNIDYQCNHYSERCYQTTDAEDAIDIIYRMMDEGIDSEAVRKDIDYQCVIFGRNRWNYLEIIDIFAIFAAEKSILL